MSQLKNKLTRGMPEWQSARMKMIIAERWLETWEALETRDIEKINLLLLGGTNSVQSRSR